MDIKKILSENLYSAFFSLCAVILAECFFLYRYEANGTFCFFITAIISVCAVILLYLNRKNSAVYVGFAAVVTLILLVMNILGISVVEFPISAVQHLLSGEELEAGELVFVSSVISLFLSAVFFPLSKIKAVRFGIALIVLAMFVAYAVIGIKTGFGEAFSFGGILICAITELCLGITYKRNSNRKISRVMSFLLPFFAVFSLLTAAVPFSEKPLDWQFVKNIATGIANTFQGLFDDISLMINPELSEFTIGMQGYSDSADSFSGSLSQTDSVQLIISSRGRLRSSVYLIGSVCDVYTGNGWEKSNGKAFSDKDYYLDYCETMIAFERMGYTREDLSRFTSRTSLSVQYKDILTKTVFYPLKSSDILCESNAETPSILLENRAENGRTYNLEYLEINYHSDEFINMVKNEYNGEITAHYLDLQVPTGIEKTLIKRAEYIKSAYTALPDTVTERTYNLAEQITDGYESNYDKLCAIEAYLKGYTYSLTPGEVPDGYDITDYFLFESHEGYCTYFATAMAVLARCEGIPTRYVQGFTADCANGKITKNYEVLSSSAHAWTEAYIDGVGWIPFEPTASRSEKRYDFLGGVTAQNIIGNYDFKYTAPDTPAAVKEEEKEENSNLLIYVIIACLLVGIAFIAAGYVVLKVKSAKKAYSLLPDTEKFLSCFKFVFFLFENMKISRENGETAGNFAKRADIAYNGEQSFKKIADIFDRVKYGDETASAEERKMLEYYAENMMNSLCKDNKKKKLEITVSYCLKHI